MFRRSENSGFTLLETVIALAILTIGILAIYSMQMKSVTGNSKANMITTASVWNAGQIEQLISSEYATLSDTDGDGTGQDSDNDGVDDDGGNFGLDDTGNAADFSATTADNQYTLFMNVAVDVPMKNLKTIRVLVRDNGNRLMRPVSFTYIKADII